MSRFSTAVVRIHNLYADSPVYCAIVIPEDAGLDSFGKVLVDFLKDHNLHATAVGLFSARLVAALCDTIPGVYIAQPHAAGADYTYDIFISFGASSHTIATVRPRYGVEERLFPVKPPYTKIAEFVYQSTRSDTTSWRSIGVLKEESDHIFGLDLDDNNKPKKFLFEKMVGGKSRITFKTV